MNCYPWGSCLPSEIPSNEPMVISNFHHQRPNGGSIFSFEELSILSTAPQPLYHGPITHSKRLIERRNKKNKTFTLWRCRISIEFLLNVSCIFFNAKLVEANPIEWLVTGISNCTANGGLIETWNFLYVRSSNAIAETRELQ